ncbi:hypothetical protein PtA15_4A435 [Puccinia triticina]|uniref:CCHC-type domain-containing protein n=1 Tax=Puccinia triticina TaxID=208348 RepID=A0ABY7CFI4_9BASI|nr:uncharacterized protein PtA15_4A435 [Puccinia triticina]WAQ83984.1 hypothetical protein PtA15_4A435 [Puccinia triticina]
MQSSISDSAAHQLGDLDWAGIKSEEKLNNLPVHLTQLLKAHHPNTTPRAGKSPAFLPSIHCIYHLPHPPHCSLLGLQILPTTPHPTRADLRSAQMDRGLAETLERLAVPFKPIDFEAYPIVSPATVQRLRDSLRRCELLRDHILQQSQDTPSRSRSSCNCKSSSDWCTPGAATEQQSSLGPVRGAPLQRPVGYPTPSHSPELPGPHEPTSESPVPPPNHTPATRLPTPSEHTPNPSRRAPRPASLNSRSRVDQHSSAHQEEPQHARPLSPPYQALATRLPTPSDPTTTDARNAPRPTDLKSRCTQANQLFAASPQPSSECPVPPPNFTAVQRLPTPNDPSTNAARHPPRPTAQESRPSQDDQLFLSQVDHLFSTSQEPNSNRPVPPPTLTDVQRLPTPSDPSTNPTANVPRPAALERRCQPILAIQEPNLERSVPPPNLTNVKRLPTPSEPARNPAQNVPRRSSLKSRAQVDQHSSVRQEPKPARPVRPPNLAAAARVSTSTDPTPNAACNAYWPTALMSPCSPVDQLFLPPQDTKSEKPAPPPPNSTAAKRLPAPSEPATNATRHAPQQTSLKNRSQLNQCSSAPQQPKPAKPPPPTALTAATRLPTSRDPRLNVARNAVGPTALKSPCSPVDQLFLPPQEPNSEKPAAPPPNSTAAKRLPTPSEPATNPTRHAPRQTSLKSRSHVDQQQEPKPARPPSPPTLTAVTHLPTPRDPRTKNVARNVLGPTALKSQSPVDQSTSEWPLPPNLIVPERLPTPSDPATDAAPNVPSPTSLKRRCSEVDQRSSTPPKRLNLNPDPSLQPRQSQPIDFSRLPVLERCLLTAIQKFVKSWTAQQLVTCLHRIILYRRRVLGWDANDSHRPIPLEDLHSALKATDSQMISHLIFSHRKQRPEHSTFRDVFSGYSVQYTIHLSGEGPQTTVELRKDFTALGLMFFPIIKTMRAFWAAHHRKAQWGEFREMFNSRAEIMPFVIPSALIKDATSLQKYIQIAANDNILVYTEADSVVAHAKTNAKAVDTLVHLSLHPDWWTGASLAYQPPEPAQPSKQNYHPFPASKAEHKICFNCQEKGHIIRDCPTLFEEPEPIAG